MPTTKQKLTDKELKEFLVEIGLSINEKKDEFFNDNTDLNVLLSEFLDFKKDSLTKSIPQEKESPSFLQQVDEVKNAILPTPVKDKKKVIMSLWFTIVALSAFIIGLGVSFLSTSSQGKKIEEINSQILFLMENFYPSGQLESKPQVPEEIIEPIEPLETGVV